MAELHVLRVFNTAGGDHGNPLGVYLRGSSVSEPNRQAVACELGFSETVFVDDAERGDMRIFTPRVELPFAGHPSVGTAWLLREMLGGVAALRPPAGMLWVRYEAEFTWVAARPEWSPPFEYIEYANAAEVDGLTASPARKGWAYCWAWENETEGRVRARSFVAEAGIPEDEATGSAALTLCAQLGRPIKVKQGRGSEIVARPVGDGYVEIGGRVILDEVRQYPVGMAGRPSRMR